jgi:hypothetical protein
LLQIAVFSVDRALLNEIAVAAANKEPMDRFKGRSTLRLIQSISTIPGAFPTHLNTCGRICVHKSGRFVVVSNRGHQPISILRVISNGTRCGELRVVGHFHTRGETPRHFQFDSSGQYLVVANQDTDTIAVFNFNLSNGEINYTGNEYRVPSPNFVCCCPVRDDDLPAPSSVMEEMVVFAKTTRADSDMESVGSTHPTDHDVDKDASPMLEELAQARAEIEELKRQLSNWQVSK